MWFSSWLRNRTVSPKRRPARRFRLGLEALEHRFVPSTTDFLYVGDVGGNGNSANDSVHRFDATTGADLGIFVDGNKSLKGPRGLIFDDAGQLLLANQNGGRGKSGEIMGYDATNGAFTDELVPFQDPNAPFAPRGIVLKDNILYVASVQDASTALTGGVERYDASTGAFLSKLVPTGFAEPFNPRGVVFGPDGSLYVSVFNAVNPLAGHVLRFDVDDDSWSVVATNDGDGMVEVGENQNLHRPEGIVFSPDGKIYVTSFRADALDNDKILVLTTTGAQVAQINLDVAGGDRAFGQALLFGPGGKLFVPISGLGPDTGAVRSYDVTTPLFPFTNFVAPGTMGQPWYLTFGNTNPATLAYEPPLAASSQALELMSAVGPAGEAVHRVTGHGVWNQVVGLPSGTMVLDQVSINARVDGNGQVHGTMVWMGTYNPLPGGGGQQVSGWTWIMRVTTLTIDGNTAHIEGVVVTSPESPADVGVGVSWDIVDNGNGPGDTLNGVLLESGNFTIH